MVDIDAANGMAEMPKLIDNITARVRDDLEQTITKKSRLRIAAACFSIYAYEELKKSLAGIDELKFIFTSPAFTTDKAEKSKREFYIPRLTREQNLYGTEFEVRLRNELTQKAIAKECAEWIKKKVTFKSNTTNQVVPGFLNVISDKGQYTYFPFNEFTTVDLGCERGNYAYNFTQRISYPMSKSYIDLFEQLWNDKKNNAQSENITVTVAGEVVLEPQVIDFDAFIKRVEASEYTFDGTLANGKKLTVKWSPVSGCFDTRSGHNCTVENEAATGNTPNRVNSDLAQYQLFKAATDVTIKNVNFEYIPADFTICANCGWAGSWTGDVVKSAQLQLETTGDGDVTIEGCSFDHVVFTSWQNSGETVIKNSAFKNIYGSYAIKDLGGSSVEVSDCTFENCGGGIMLDSNSGRAVTPNPVTISGNTFTKVDVDGTTPENKVSTRGLLQIPSKGDYTNTAIILDGNTATNCGPILRQLNQGIVDDDVLKKNLKGDLTGLGGRLTYTEDSLKKEGEDTPAQPTVYTVKFENADVADMKVIEGTEITLPTPGNRPNYKFEGWYVGYTKVSSPYTVTGDVTLVAQWRYIDQGGGSSSSSGDYSISVDADKHGTVTVSPKRADKGDTVTITVKPNKGYELDELTVTDKDGDEIKLTEKADNKFTFKMPGSKVTVEATFKLIDTEPENPFYDVDKDAYYYDAVLWAVEQGITSGTSDTTFSPNASCTRAQMVTFLWRANGSPKADGANPFTDVSADAYYYDAVLWAVKEGITSGTSATTFAPDMTVTRGQTVTFLWRANGSPAVSGSNFGDVAADAYYASAVAWAVSEGVTSGTSATTFSPDAACTRAQIVTFLFRELAE